MKQMLDSYTKKPIELDYVSPFIGINQPRQLYKPASCQVSAQYSAQEQPDGLWLLRREGTPPGFLPVMPDEATARKALDWLIINDGSVGVAIWWLAKGEGDPYFRLLNKLWELI